MPIKAPYTGKARGARRAVVYRDAAGHSFGAVVLGPGTGSGYKIKLESITNSTLAIKDNIPLATTAKSTNAIFNRQ